VLSIKYLLVFLTVARVFHALVGAIKTLIILIEFDDIASQSLYRVNQNGPRPALDPGNADNRVVPVHQIIGGTVRIIHARYYLLRAGVPIGYIV
jgi:hypothetical protein